MLNSSSTRDTIAAIATAPGQGGIGIVRMSGPASRDILHTLFEAGGDAFSFVPRLMHHGWIRDAAGERLDEVLAVWMPGPGTATGEDTGEIHCHGGPAILAAVLEATLAAGARMAGPGEFTYRAFMNGKYDLTQAEAIAEMIAAPSRQGLRLARAKLEGVMGTRVAALRDLVDEMRARMTLSIDFVEDDVDDFDAAGFRQLLSRLQDDLRALLAGYGRARLWREGALAVLAGRVNVGKSSLLNALLGRNRAIVSDIPGTTRDFIEEALDLDGLPLRLVDTAGLREGEDAVEEEGVRLSRQLTGDADILLLVLAAGQPVSSDERELLFRNPEKTLIVVNKIDTAGEKREKALTAHGLPSALPPVAVSAKTGEGLEELAARLRAFTLAQTGGSDGTGDLAPNVRQSALLKSALEEAESLRGDFDAHMPHDLLAVRLDALAATLDEVSGHAAPDDILSRIFSRFCIGK
ncbi:tRNA uridine-5-carboxymethylaminomethyl(34) synthesis GTPase MnmE [Desulfovibrio sp. OttesenSCG-928-I05]|nr:tRNA uridine-5-carboxymethylaminomethyl(34) synthesis GTPase MnmE [Desulfovibrio sp. OttesenSCG-928-I05]